MCWSFRRRLRAIFSMPIRQRLRTLIAVVQKIAIAAQGGLRRRRRDDHAVQRSRRPARSVFHLHFHVIPRHDGVPLKPHSGKMEDGAVSRRTPRRSRRRSRRLRAQSPQSVQSPATSTSDRRGDADRTVSRAMKKATAAAATAPRRSQSGDCCEHAGRIEDEFGDDRRDQRRRNRPHPVQRFGIFTQPVAGQHAEPAPDIGRAASLRSR